MPKSMRDVITVPEDVSRRVSLLTAKIDSSMHFQSNFAGNAMSYDWLEMIENACPFIDNVVRKPKLTLIQEENTVKIEKSKRITVASIKDLSRHTNYISKINKETNDVEPSKILDIRNEETYNIYENRFLYTLIHDLSSFLYQKESILDDIEIRDRKCLEYRAGSYTDEEKIKLELKISSNDLPDGNVRDSLKDDIELVKGRIKRVREYITSWQRSDMIKALDKAHISYISPPIKKTNIILKNPNFQVAVNLWQKILSYSDMEGNSSKDALETSGDDKIKRFLDHSFLISYFILDSISKTKREQKEKLSNYAIVLITEEMELLLSLLMELGITMSLDDLLGIVASSVKNESSKKALGSEEIKKKFKNIMDEYLEKAKECL